MFASVGNTVSFKWLLWLRLLVLACLCVLCSNTHNPSHAHGQHLGGVGPVDLLSPSCMHQCDTLTLSLTPQVISKWVMIDPVELLQSDRLLSLSLSLTLTLTLTQGSFSLTKCFTPSTPPDYALLLATPAYC
jgi:hypothetical protein